MNKQWFRLDTAGILFASTINKRWSNVFRLSVTLKDTIDPVVLQQAVDELEYRFPTIYVSLHRGVFWNYLETTNASIKVQSDYAYPLTYMSYQQLRKACIRVLYFKNRIAVEFFHSITDGTGGRVYLCSLIAHYLKLKYQLEFEYTNQVLNPQDQVSQQECEDSFHKNSCHVQAKRNGEEKAYHLTGEKLEDESNILITAFIQTDKLLEVAHRFDCKITPFLCAVMSQAMMEIQDEEKSRKFQKPINITVPVELRKIYGSKTLRNFAQTINVGIDPRRGDYSLQDLCDSYKHQIALLSTKQNLAPIIYANTSIQNIPLVKLAPLFLKRLIVTASYDNSAGEKSGSLHISNLGALTLPEEISKHIDYMEFIIGLQKSYKNNCSVCSINNITTINMIRAIKESKLEQKFFSKLVELGIPVEIECNRR